MPSQTVALFTKAVSIVIGFAGLAFVFAIIAVFAARNWGAGSQRKRQAIYSITTFVGIVAAGYFTLYRIRHLV